jgi:hypothetical protein
MRYHGGFGHSSFVLCPGHLSEVIRDYLVRYDLGQNDVRLSLGQRSSVEYLSSHGEQGWEVLLADALLVAR